MTVSIVTPLESVLQRNNNLISPFERHINALIYDFEEMHFMFMTAVRCWRLWSNNTQLMHNVDVLFVMCCLALHRQPNNKF